MTPYTSEDLVPMPIVKTIKVKCVQKGKLEFEDLNAIDKTPKMM